MGFFILGTVFGIFLCFLAIVLIAVGMNMEKEKSK